MYILTNERGLVILALYMDDLIIASTHQELIEEIKSKLVNPFCMMQLGSLAYCLGVQVLRDWTSGTISILQEKYISYKFARFI